MTGAAVLLDEIVRPGGELKITRDDSHPAYSNAARWKAIVFEPRRDSPYLRPVHTITGSTAVELLNKLQEIADGNTSA